MYTHEERRAQLDKILSMVRSLNGSPIEPPECKKSRCEMPQSEENLRKQQPSEGTNSMNEEPIPQQQPSAVQLSVAQPRAAQISVAQPRATQLSVALPSASQLTVAQLSMPELSVAQLSMAQLIEPPQTALQPRKRHGKERLNDLKQGETDWSNAKFILRQPKSAPYEKVLEWMNNNENSSCSCEETIIITNSFERRQAMERILHLVRNYFNFVQDTSTPGSSTSDHGGPSEHRVLQSVYDFGRTDIEFGLTESDFGQTDSEFTLTESDYTQTEFELAPTVSELGDSQSETLLSVSESESEETESDSELDETDSELEETERILRSLDTITNTPEITSDSSGQETFYSCESNDDYDSRS